MDNTTPLPAELTLDQQYEILKQDNEELRNKLLEVNQLNEKLTNENIDIQKKKNEINQNITDFTNEVEVMSDENASLAGMVQKEFEKHSAAIKAGKQAIETVDKFKMYWKALAHYIKLPIPDDPDDKVIEKILDEVIKLKKFTEAKLSEELKRKEALRNSISTQATSGESLTPPITQSKKKGGATIHFLQRAGVLRKP